MDAPPTRPNLLHLEQLVLGEREAETAQGLSQAELRVRLDALVDDSATVLRDYPAERIVPAVVRRVAAETRRRRTTRRALAYGMAVLVPAATVVVCFVQTPGDPVMLDGPDPPAAFELEPTRLKGVEPSLFVYRLAEGGNQAGERVPAQALVHEGELVQLAYLSGEFTHGTVLSIDGRGHVTVHHPDESGDTRLGAGPTALDHAFELDDAPEFERFVFVVGHEPLDTKKIVRAAEVVASLGPVARVIPLPLEPTLRQVSVVVRKPAKPP